MADKLKTFHGYNIYNTPTLDTDSEKTDRTGWIEYSTDVYWIQGNLPEGVIAELARIAESRGLKYWGNNGKRSDAVRSTRQRNSDAN